MAPTVTSLEIGRSATEVFDYATDPSAFSDWQQGVVDGHMQHAGPTPQAGDLCSTTRRIGGTDRASTSRLDHIAPPRTWGVRGIDGPVRAIVDLTVEALTGSSCRLTISVDFEGHGIGKILVPLVVRRQARKEMPTNLSTLKRLLEDPAGPPARVD